MKCFGQNDQKAPVKYNGKEVTTCKIAGRHVNQFIGDIRTESSDKNALITVNIVEPVVSGNIYVGSGYMYSKKSDDVEIYADSSDAATYDYNHTWSSTDTSYIGSAYYVGVTVNLFITEIHMGDYEGRVYITENGTKTTVGIYGGLG